MHACVLLPGSISLRSLTTCDLCLPRDQHRPISEACSQQTLVNDSFLLGSRGRWIPDQVACCLICQILPVHRLFFLMINLKIRNRTEQQACRTSPSFPEHPRVSSKQENSMSRIQQQTCREPCSPLYPEGKQQCLPCLGKILLVLPISGSSSSAKPSSALSERVNCFFLCILSCLY